MMLEASARRRRPRPGPAAATAAASTSAGGCSRSRATASSSPCRRSASGRPCARASGSAGSRASASGASTRSVVAPPRQPAAARRSSGTSTGSRSPASARGGRRDPPRRLALGGPLHVLDAAARERRAHGEPRRRAPRRRVRRHRVRARQGRSRLLPPAARAPAPRARRRRRRRRRRSSCASAPASSSPTSSASRLPHDVYHAEDCLTASALLLRSRRPRRSARPHGAPRRGVRRPVPRRVPAPLDPRGLALPGRERGDAPRRVERTFGVGPLPDHERRRRRPLRAASIPCVVAARGPMRWARARARSSSPSAASRSERTPSRTLRAFARVREHAPAARLWILGGATVLDHGAYRAAFDRELGVAARGGAPARSRASASSPTTTCRRSSIWPASSRFRRSTRASAWPRSRGWPPGIPVVASRRAPLTEFLDDVVRDPRRPDVRRRHRARARRPRSQPRARRAATRASAAPASTRGRASPRCTSSITARSLATRWSRPSRTRRSVMPEMHFLVRWPDGKEQRCYSPSLIVRDHLEVGA